MADNQTRERVGKPAGNTLSAIDLALADLAENTAVKRDGEFTTGDISKAYPEELTNIEAFTKGRIKVGDVIECYRTEEVARTLQASNANS